MSARYDLEPLEFRRLFVIDAPVLNSAALDFDSTLDQYKYTASWSSVAGASQYRVEWGADGFNFPSSAVQPAIVTTITDPLPLSTFSGESRYYRIRAIASNGEVSAPSNVIYNTAIGGLPAVDYADQLNVDASEPPIGLRWPALGDAGKFVISAWLPNSTTGVYEWKDLDEVIAHPFGTPAPPRTQIFSWADTEPRDFEAGVEYRITSFRRNPGFVPGPNPDEKPEFLLRNTGYAVAKKNGTLQDSRGKVLMVVDNRFTTRLASEIAQFQQDLIGDGWQIQGVEPVATDTDPANPSDTRAGVPVVKQKILDAYTASGGQLKSVILIGHVPVPYSGTGNQGDGHGDHQGAWVADSYYGDLQNAGWIDGSTTNIVTGQRDPENHNRPNDGEFDQTNIPSDIELSVGRIDFAKMTTFIEKVQDEAAMNNEMISAFEAEARLLARYFQKNHDYRHRNVEVLREAKIDSNAGLPGRDFWRTMSTIFRASEVKHRTWASTSGVYASEPGLWMYAGGSGNNDLVAGAARTEEILNSPAPVNAVFHHFRGSWSGDWDKPARPSFGYDDSVMNTVLAETGVGLVSIWGGIGEVGDWFLHSMATGATMGEGYLHGINGANKYEYLPAFSSYSSRSILGDPTLRLHVVAPVSDVSVIREQFGQGGVTTTINYLSWTASPDEEVLGYHVYRAATPDGPFTRVTTSPVTGTYFNNTTTIEDAVYMVRAVKLEDTPSGTYYNASTGILAIEIGGGGGEGAAMALTGGGWTGNSFSSGASSFGGNSGGGLVNVSIFDDLFSDDQAALDPLAPTPQQTSASSSPQTSGAATLHTGPVVVFNVFIASTPTSLGATPPAQRIDVYLPTAGNTAGRRVELFDATTHRLLARRDIASVGNHGSTLSMNNIAPGSAFTVRVSGLTGTGDVTAAARVVSAST